MSFNMTYSKRALLESDSLPLSSFPGRMFTLLDESSYSAWERTFFQFGEEGGLTRDDCSEEIHLGLAEFRVREYKDSCPTPGISFVFGLFAECVPIITSGLEGIRSWQTAKHNYNKATSVTEIRS